MTEASPKKTAAAATKKKSVPKVPAEHPKYSEMIKAAVAALAERKGSSRQAIVKYIKANYKVTDNCNIHIKQALKRSVVGGELLQVKGTGASGSFKLSVKAKAKPKAKKPAAKKPAAKKPAAKAKKTPIKKKAAAKKPVAKKAKKTPVKGKKKAAAKKPVKKPVAKKPAAKKAAKKTPKKKTAAKK